jgi:hypothetical protein
MFKTSRICKPGVIFLIFIWHKHVTNSYIFRLINLRFTLLADDYAKTVKGEWDVLRNVARYVHCISLCILFPCTSIIEIKIVDRNFVCILCSHLGFQVLTAMIMKNVIFWDIAPCSSLKINWRLGEKYRYVSTADGSNSSLWNFSWRSTD